MSCQGAEGPHAGRISPMDVEVAKNGDRSRGQREEREQEATWSQKVVPLQTLKTLQFPTTPGTGLGGEEEESQAEGYVG